MLPPTAVVISFASSSFLSSRRQLRYLRSTVCRKLLLSFNIKQCCSRLCCFKSEFLWLSWAAEVLFSFELDLNDRSRTAFPQIPLVENQTTPGTAQHPFKLAANLLKDCQQIQLQQIKILWPDTWKLSPNAHKHQATSFYSDFELFRDPNKHIIKRSQQ